MTETNYQLMRRQGVSRRSFLKFCSLTAASLGLGANGAADIAHAMETKPSTPVIWLHGLECTCCTESFIRSYHPLTKDVILSMISLAYDDTLMVAAGEQDHQALEDVMKNSTATTSWLLKDLPASALTACSSARRQTLP